MAKGKIIIASLFVLIISFFMYSIHNYSSLLETNKRLVNFNNESCYRIEIKSNGPEDITELNDDYLVTASGNTIEIWYHYNKPTEKVPNGHIILIPKTKSSASSYSDKDLIYLEITNTPNIYSFHAHGLYVNNNKLYVLNHAYKSGGERLDVFNIDINNKKAVLIDSFIFPSELYGITNDIVVLDNKNDEDSFFVTTWQLFPHTEHGPNKLLHFLNIFIIGALRIEKTYVYSCSFKNRDCRILEETKGLMNNSVTYNKNKSTLYVSDSILSTIKQYEVKPDLKNKGHNLLKYISQYKMDYMLDNIEYNEKTNKIYASLISRGGDYFKIADHVKKYKYFPAPSNTSFGASGSAEINLSLNIKDSKFTRYLNFNNKILGGSSGVVYDNKIYYGSWGDNAICVCDIITKLEK